MTRDLLECPYECPACRGWGVIMHPHRDPQQAFTTPCSWCGETGVVSQESLQAYWQRASDHQL